MNPRRGGFTLFELILAIALSAGLLALIGTAINLYLLQVDAGRTRVEEAQLARSILAMIADDLRATTVYQPQDTSGIARLMASGTPFDVDSIDEERTESSESDGGATQVTVGDSGGQSSSGSGGSSFGSSSTPGMSSETAIGLPLGLSGTINELYVDVTRLPRQEELFSTMTGYTNAPLPVPAGGAAMLPAAATGWGIPPSDLKTVRYFIRPGAEVGPGSLAATSLAPDLQLRAGGLVRQELSRTTRLFAEQTGESALLDSGQSLIAPEVVQLEFRYFDGRQVVDMWDMNEMKLLPIAIEVRIWLAPPDENRSRGASQYDVASLADWAREYRQIIYLPMSESSSANAAGAMGGASSGSASDSSSSSESSSVAPLE
jgi:hypothetical protein